MARDPQDDPEETARRLMREGLGDEAIEAATGLSLMRLLAIRAGAAVEDRPAPRRAQAPPDGGDIDPGL